jgi:hypothetical protein
MFRIEHKLLFDGRSTFIYRRYQMSSFLFRTKLLLWDQSPGDKEVVVAYDGDSLHTFLLDLDNVAGASVPALGK